MGNITTAMVKQFGRNIELLSQQKGSKLRDCVRVETGIVGEDAYFDQLADTAAVRKTTRNADTPLVKSDHRRRRVSMYDYEWADLIDTQDKLKMLADPNGPYSMNAAYAMGRAMDDLLISEFSGTAYTGKEGGTSTSFDSNNQIAHGSTGLTITKLLSAKELLDLGDVDPEEPRYIAVSPKAITDLLDTTEIKSSDYNTVKALAKGEIDTFCGFKFIVSNRLAVASSIRTCLAWAKNGILLALAQEIVSKIDERADKGYATQVYCKMGIGATRMEEAKCIEIGVDES